MRNGAKPLGAAGLGPGGGGAAGADGGGQAAGDAAPGLGRLRLGVTLRCVVSRSATQKGADDRRGVQIEEVVPVFAHGHWTGRAPVFFPPV